jgi:acyl-[acyl-carrier-protein]-phospholipid O-acyltransferase/long-chain-fatty-acid--[acyl-carrier-protein] ligase
LNAIRPRAQTDFIPGMKSPRVSLAALMGAQAQVTFNDNAAKLMLIALAQFPGVLPDFDPNLIRGVLSGMLVAPFILFSPLAGWVVDRFSKSTVLNVALCVQAVVMVLLAGSLWLHSLWGAVTGFLLLSLQACVFAPAKRGILRELVTAEGLSRAVGLMEMLSVTFILAGIFAGGWLFDTLTRYKMGHGGLVGADAAWSGALLTAMVLAGLSVGSWLVFQLVHRTPAQSREPFQANLFWRHRSQVRELWRDRPLLRATFGIMFFYGMGGYMLVLFLQMGAERHGGNVGSATAASVMALLLGVGTLVGNLIAGLLSRRGVELGLVPLGGVLLTVALAALGWIGQATASFHAWLVVAGFASGLFLVPLYAFIQETAGAHRRGRVLAAVGLLDSSAGLLANGVFYVFAGQRLLDWSPATQLFALTLFTAAMLGYALWHLPHQTVCTVMRLIGPIFYRVRVLGHANIPSGGALVICNHLSYVDAVVLQIASPRPMRFVAFAGFVKSPFVRFVFRAAGVIPVNANKPAKGIRLAVDALKKGELVCIFPEGAISRTGQLMLLKRGFETIARQARAPIVPACIDGLWGSIYSFAGNKYLWKSPRLMPTHVCVLFGAPIPPVRADPAAVRRALLDLGEQAFQERPFLRRHLGREVVRSLARQPWRRQLVDRTVERRELSAAKLLAAAAALSRHLQATVPEKRVGIVLPPGAGATIANLAVMCAGKTPVNLNFTAGRAAAEASLRLGEIKTVLTADAMRAKIPHFPFPESTLDLRQAIEAAGGKGAIMPWLLATWLLPNQWVATLLGLPRTGDREEAALLFTSGSAGEPKGVVLTHRNILANCAQVSSLSILPKTATMIGCLPVFHSFGFTVTVWYPLLRGCLLVTLPSPLDTRKIVEAIQQEKATVMIGAPTFIRPLLKKATREELATLDLVVTGAEKLPQDLYEAFLQQFGIEILQGYGLTETSPVTNVNQHHPPITTSTAEHQLGKRTGSVGRLMPGMTARIVDPDTGEDLPASSTGMVWLRGANVFSGYLKDPEKTAAALKDGWFVTGDLGRFDEDGFLYIEGRLSRFSKLGGEMVPHGTIEQRIIELFGWTDSETATAVVTGVPDPMKGEALVLLTTQDVTAEELRARLLEAGLPNLWIPKIVRKVPQIPLLGTGKTDLKGCRAIAIELTRETYAG